MKCNLFRNVKKTVNFLVIIVCSLALVLSATLIVTPELNVKSAQASVIIDSPTTSNIFTIKDITFTLSYNSWIEDKNMAALFSGSTGHPFFVAENSSDKITVSGLAAPISQSTNINSDTNVSDTILASEIRSDITYKLWSSQCSTAGGGYTNTCRVHKAKVFKEVGDLLYSWTFTKTSTIKEISIGDSTNYNDGYYQFGNDIDTLFLNKFVNSLVLDSDAMPTPNPSPSSSSSPSPSGVKLVFDSVSYDYYASRPTYNIKLKLVDGYFSSNVDSGDLSFGGIWAGSLVNNVTTVVEDNSKKAILISLSKNQAQKGQTGQIYINKDKIVDNVSQQKAIADLEIAVTDNYISSIIESYDPKAKDIVFAYDEKQAIDDANKSLNARANNNADSFIKGSVVPVAAERTGYFLHEGLNKVVSYLSDNVNKALNNIEGANGFIVQQTGSAANWIFNKAANSFISFLPIKDLLQSAIGAVANYFIDLMFDAPFVYHMSKTTDNEDPTQLDNVQTAISDLSTQLTESTDKLVNLDTAGTLRNDTSKLNEYILLTKNKFAALQRGVTIANYMVAQTKVSESGVALDNTNSAAVKLAFQEVYKSYDVGTNENSVTQFKTYLDNITDLILGDSGITSNKGNIFEINDKIQELMHDFNSETFKERINFINSVYAMVMPWTSLVLNSMLFDAIRNEDLALAYELEVSNLDNLISSGSLRDDDMVKIKDTKKQFEFYAADARLLADTSNRNVQTLENRTAKITLARGESLRKVYKEMTQFYDVNKPSVYNYRLKRYFVPFVFNSLAYPGIDNSIAVSAADMMGNTNDKNNSLIKPNSGWHLDMKQIESWCFSYDPNDREKCRSVESGDAGLWKENNPYNPSVYYMPDKTLKNTFSKHIFSNTLEANKGLRGDKFYNKTVVSAEDLKTIKHYAAASNIDKPLHDASFQFMSLDTATNGFKNQCDNYLGGNNDTNCFLNASTIGPVQAAPVEASMYYSNVDTPQKLDAGLYTGVDSQYKSLGWVTSENQANLAETNLWPSEKSDHRQTSAPRFVDKLNIWHKFVTKSDKYINNAIQKVNTLDSKLNWQTNQTIAQIYTGQDVFNNDNLTTYNQCKDNNDNNKKCIRYFNNQTVNWLEYRNTDEVPSVDEAKIDLSIVPSSKQLDKTIDKDVSKITNGNIFDYYNTYYGTATNSITYYQGLLQLVKERTLNAKNHPNSYEQAELGYWRNVHTCTDYFLFISCEDSKQWVKTGTTPAFTWGTTIDYMSNGLYAFGAFSDDGKYTIDGQIYINPVKYNGHTYKKSQIRDFISEYLKAKFNLPSGGYITPDQVIKQIDGDLSNEAFFLQWSPNDYTKAFYDAYKNIPKMSGNARSMIVYGAKQVSDYLGTDGFNYLQSGKTLSTYIGDAAASSVVNKIFATFFQAMIGEGWGPNIMTYAGIGVQPIQFQLYPGWKALGLTRSDFGLKGFWVRGERIDGKPGTVKYHAEGYTGFSPLTIDLSSIKVRPMIKASGDANWSWGGQTQRTAPFAYDFLVWTGLNETIEYNMMVKVCGLEYTSDAWICKDTYTRSTYPSK